MLTSIAFVALAAFAQSAPQAPAGLAPEQVSASKTPPYAGAVFTAQIARGYKVTESGSGQVHFFEVRRPGSAADVNFPSLKLLCAPGAAASGTGQQFADVLASEVQAFATSESMDVVTNVEVEFLIGGVIRAGRRFEVGQAGAGELLEIDVLAYSSGESLIGMIAKATPGDRQSMRAMAEQLRSSLKVKPVTMASAKLVQLDNFTMEVPLVSPTLLSGSDTAAFLKVGAGTGMIEIGSQEMVTEDQAREVGTAYLGAQEEALRETITAGGGVVSDLRWAGEWIQDGQLVGFHMDFVQADTTAFTVSTFHLVVGRNFVNVIATATEEDRPAVLARLRDMLESLQSLDEPEALHIALGQTSLIQANGLTLYYPDSLRLTQSGDGHFSLTGQSSLQESDLTVDLEVRPDRTTAEQLEVLMLSSIEQRFPGAELSPADAIEAGLLGERREGLGITWTFEGESYRSLALQAPLHDGSLVAQCTSRLENASSASWTFANLMAGLKQLEVGERWITSNAFDVVFDPANWKADSNHTGTGNSFLFKHLVHGTEVAFEGGLSPLKPGDETSISSLMEAANPYFEMQESWLGPNMKGGLNGTVDITGSDTEALDFGGATALHKQVRFVASDGESYVLELYFLLAEKSSVGIYYVAKETDTEAIEAATSLIETLNLKSALGLERQVQVLGDLRVELPLGYVHDAKEKGSYRTLYFWSALVEESFAAVARIPAADLPAMDILWENVNASVLALVAPELLDELTIEATEILFLGQPSEARRFEYTMDGGEGRVIQLKSVVLVGDWIYEITIAAPLEKQAEFDQLEDALKSVVQVPALRQVADKGYNLAFDPGQFGLLRIEQPGSVTDGFSFSGADGGAVFHIAEDGAWSHGDAELPEAFAPIQNTLTSQFDLAATKPFAVDTDAAKLRFSSSTNTTEQAIEDGMSFSNEANSEGLYITVKFLDSVNRPQRLMEESILNDSAYDVRDFHLLEREILGAKSTGHMATFTDADGLWYANQKFLVDVPGGVLELYVVWAPGGENLGLTQANLFFDSLELVE